MDISLGFIVLLVLVIFPGLIFRRLYFYGEFSKQFTSGHNLIWLIAVSAIPGVILLSAVFFFYCHYVSGIDLGEIIDKLKEINDPSIVFKKKEDTPLNELLFTNVMPFVSFLYAISIFFGSISGRLIRLTGLDTKFKLLRFKNEWFYLFHGHHTSFKKMKHLKQKGKTLIFTKADILIDGHNETMLYSGIVVDYELKISDSSALSKVMLQHAMRYRLQDNEKVPAPIPGSLLVVDCENMVNINFTYVNKKAPTFLKSKAPGKIEAVMGVLFLLLFLFLVIFEVESIQWTLYNELFERPWYLRLLAFLFTTQSIGLFKPFERKKEDFVFINWKILRARLIASAILAIWLYLVW